MPEKMNIDINELEAAVREAAKIFSDREESADVTIKGRADYVTAVDFHVQKFLSERLRQLYPDIQFAGEEKDNSEIDWSGSAWILDPVDGTTNLIHDMRASVISLGLAVGGQMEIGIIYWPYMNEMFTARRGCGAYLNGKPIHVTDVTDIRKSLVSLGTSPYNREFADWTFSAAKQIYLEAQDIRRAGAAALELAYVACGRLEAMFERVLSPWDYSAGLLIVEEAGGRVTDLQGNPVKIGTKGGILATNAGVHEKLVDILIQA